MTSESSEDGEIRVDLDKEARFGLGTTVMTRGVAALRDEDAGRFARGMASALARYVSGDWGDIPPEDAEMNDAALAAEEGGGDTDRLMAAYDICGTAVWLVTEYDRSVTTAMLPSEY